MNLLLLIPDGVGVRNFVLGGFLTEITKSADAYVLHTIPDHLLEACRGETDDNIQWDELIPYKESPLSFTLRYSLAYAQMNWADTRSMRYNRRLPVKGSWRTRMVHQAASLIGKAGATPKRIKILDRWHSEEVNRLPEVAHYRRVFEHINPSVLFCSHQRPPSILPGVLAARSLNIPTATFIFSWDNLTSKGRIAAPFDHFLVWSDHMREELLKYYPDVASDRVHVVGTPQFDSYADKSLLWTRKEFYGRIGADITRRLICYSGGDKGTCPEEPQQLRVLLDLIRAGAIEKSTQVLLRPAPVDDGRRYDQVRLDFPELIYARPKWEHTKIDDWSGVIPLQDDIQFLANLTHHADLNVNVASTMTLDFAIHDKPVVNIAFDVSDRRPFGVPLWDFFYQFEHYRPVVELCSARFARSPQELATHVNAYLDNPGLDRDGRRKLVALEVGVPLGHSTQEISRVLRSIASNA